MQMTLFKSKIHRATVTEADLHYQGSIGIDRDLIDAAGMIPYEQVDVLNINNGERFTTYVIEMPRGSGAITINGAAARLAQKGDMVIIISYASMSEEEAKTWQPTVVYADADNKPKRAS